MQQIITYQYYKGPIRKRDPAYLKSDLLTDPFVATLFNPVASTNWFVVRFDWRSFYLLVHYTPSLKLY
jgi:hypothetical protein